MVCEDDVTVKGGFSRMYPIGVANSEGYAGIVFSGENKEVAEAQNKGTQNKRGSSACDFIHPSTLRQSMSSPIQLGDREDSH